MAFCGALLFILSGCAWQERGAVTLYRPDLAAMKEMAVLPFVVRPGGSEGQTLPGVGSVREQVTIESKPAVALNEILFSGAQNRPGWRIIDEEKFQEISLEVAVPGPGEDKARFFMALGKKLGVDGILSGQVWRYRERRGHDFAVEQAASVAFSLTLFSSRDGLPVWKGVFDETQKSLLENLLAFSSFRGRGGRWATARELSTEGMDSLLRRLPPEVR